MEESKNDQSNDGYNGNTDFLTIIGKSIGFEPNQSYYTVQGLHYAQGFKTERANEIYADGMQQDCDNINMNRKLATNFRSDIFGDGIIGFFDSCVLEEVTGAKTSMINATATTNKNLYTFTLTSANKSQIDLLCSEENPLPIVYDDQHDTYWIDEPFNCTTTSLRK